jgi:hypothetical protein
MPNESALSSAQLDQFVEEGYVRLNDAFSKELATECRDLLWKETGCNPADPTTWVSPVIRVGERFDAPFRAAANTPQLHAAFDALLGATRWFPRASLGTFPIRFPSQEEPGDCGWHVDVSLGFEDTPDFMEWRSNVFSQGRALLMLFLFSDVGERDAPTLLRPGSHRDVARLLAPHGEFGLSLRQLVNAGFGQTGHRSEVAAVGDAGTVYLVHPFLVHRAQRHQGHSPRFLAQPPLFSRGPLDPLRNDGGANAVERAIQRALLT